MKKLTILGLLLTTVFLASCGSQPSADSEASETSSSETSTSSTVESEATTIFTGVIQEDATAGDSDTFQVFLNDIEAVDDQETIVPNFQTDGVILHVPQEAFSGEMADLVKGTKVQVTLQGLPIMTMSIPPQVPGNSIQTIEIIE